MEKRDSLTFRHLTAPRVLERSSAFLRARPEDGHSARKQILHALKCRETSRLALGETLLRLFLSLHETQVKGLGKTGLLLGRRGAGAEITALQCQVRRFPEDGDLEEALRPRDVLVSIDWADPVTGVLRPVLEYAEICREKGVLLHVDATHAIGREYLDWEELSDVFLTIQGAIPQQELLIFPEGAVEKALLPPPSPPWLMELTYHALMERLQEFDSVMTHVATLRALFEEGVKALGGEILHERSPRIPSITALSFPHVHPEMLCYALEKRGISIEAPASWIFSPLHSEEDIQRALGALREALFEVRPLTEAFSEERA